MALPDLQVFAYDDFTKPLMVSFDGGTTWSSPGQIEDGTGFYVGMRFGNFGGTDAQNVAFSLSLDGTAVLTQSLPDVVVDCYYTYTYGELSLAPGSHTFLLTVDPGNKIAESNESNNSYSWTITVSGSTAPYLMDTLWGQSDLLPGSDVYINAFAPIDPDTGTRSLTGCVNTAVAQVMSYFAQEGYGFTVTLDAADAFVSGGRIAITSAQFGQINDLLEDFDADSPLDIAALTFASGVILESSFGSAETSTSGSGKEVFMRAGFKSVSEAHKGFSDLWNGSSLSDKGWNMLKNNMAAGRPVLTSIPEPAHAVVIDGYDSLTDSVHINFGWGLFGNKKFDSTYGLDLGTGWYSRSECDNLGLRSFTYDITPDTTAPKVENIVCSYEAAYAELTLSVSDDVGVSKQFYRLTPSGEWLAFSGTLKVETDGTVYFRVCDRAGNYSAEKTFLVEGLSSPLSLTVSKVPEAWTRQDVLLTASASGGKGELVIYFKTGDENWQLYSENVRLEENGTVFFKAVDSRGVESEIVERHVSCIDKEAPEIPSSLTETVDKQNVRLDWGISSDNGKAGTTGYYIRYGAAEALSGDGEFVSENSFSLENLDYGSWFYQIRSVDALGNLSEWSAVKMFDVLAPLLVTVEGLPEAWTRQDVLLTASASGGKGELVIYFKTGDENWQLYSENVRLEENGTVFFKAVDSRGVESEIVERHVSCIDKEAPEIPSSLTETVDKQNVRFDWGISSDNGKAGTTGYYIRYGAAEALSGDGEFVSENSFSLENLDYGSWFYQIRSVDALGNLSEWSERQRFEVIPESPQGLKSSVGSLSWEKHPQAENYTVAMNSGFAGFTLETAETCVDLFGLPGGVWQWQVKVSGWEKSSRGDEIVSEENALRSTRIISDADGYADVFFVAPSGVWERGYSAVHQGFSDGWTGTGERVALGGKNKITSVFEGSGDANILVLSNDACGDALFMEDIYSAFPDEQVQSRLARIHEIRSGAGDDIIDLTGQCFAYEGKAMSIYGGAGDDHLWAAACGGRLFGEDGDDFLTGGSGADILCGGAGNDRFHGGGGEDTFVFSGSWGEDTVEQLASGRVILQFSSGSSGNWDAEALVYSDGENKVTVCGVAAEQIQLVFLDAPGS